MRLIIAAIGRLKSGPEADLAADYARRAAAVGKALALTPVDILEAESKPPGDKAREAGLLQAAAPPGAVRVLLDERGDAWTSRTLADRLSRWRDAGVPAAVFWIGGADGTDPALKAAADHSLAFGPQTWPHRLVRAMLAEQLYRAVTLLAGLPYHRD